MSHQEWQFCPRTYPHFDHVIYNETEAREIITKFQKTGCHAFLPFLEYSVQQRRFSKYLEKIRLLEVGADVTAMSVNKRRPIKYAAHQDTQIFSYYRYILASQYENKLHDLGIHEHVIAYRKIPITANTNKGKCNIHFAKEAFDEIASKGNSFVMTFDIEGFFESLDHDFLRQKWQVIIERSELPKDHEAVFNAVTNYSFVNHQACFESLGLIKMNGTKKKFQHCPFSIFKQRKMLCDKNTYREKVIEKGLVNKNNYGGKGTPQGIPQGSPISDVLANLYMIDFDLEMSALSKEKGAYYRRYSDDILWICNQEDSEIIEQRTRESLIRQGNRTLKIKDEKTTKTIFFRQDSHHIYHGDKFSYLGFSFDGCRALYRDSTISNYLRDVSFSIDSFVKRAHERSVGNPKKGTIGNGKTLKDNLNISQIYHKTGYLNKEYQNMKREKYQNSNKKNYTPRPEGNFMTYHLRAMHIFNIDSNSTYQLSDSQLKNYRKYIKDRILKKAKFYDPDFSL